MKENKLLIIILAPFFFVWWLFKLFFKTIKSILEETAKVMTGIISKILAIVVLLVFIALITQYLIK